MNAPSYKNSPADCRRPPLESTLVSVVLPVYNEAEALPILAARIAEVLMDCGVQYEILFVNDGSSDDSPRILDQLAAASRRIRVLHLSRNFGHQSAVQAGLACAGGDAVILMDSDMQDAPDAIPRFLREWEAGYDVVYGVRTQRKEFWLKRLLFAAFHRLMSSVASIPMPADAGIFGLIDRRVARQIMALGETDRYFPGLRSWVGFRQTGIQIERNARYDKRPRVSLCGLFRLAKTAVFSFSTFPLLIFHFIGAAAWLVFLGLGSFALFCKVFTNYAIPGWTSHILTGSFFGAINALGISILGEYVVRIHDQVRGRPQYIVDRAVNVGGSEERRSHRRSPVTSSARFDLDDLWSDADYLDLLDEASQMMQEAEATADQQRPGEREEEDESLLAFPMREGY